MADNLEEEYGVIPGEVGLADPGAPEKVLGILVRGAKAPLEQQGFDRPVGGALLYRAEEFAARVMF